jgi:hypothetical protein
MHAGKFFGAIAQLGERLHGMQEVVGSSPIGSTFFTTGLARALRGNARLFDPHRSRRGFMPGLAVTLQLGSDPMGPDPT